MDNQEIAGVRAALASLRREEETIRKQIEPLMGQWRHKQEQIAALERALDLLESEPEARTLPIASAGNGGMERPSDLAYRVLAEARKPTHYRELLRLMEATGFSMPGENPGANLLAHIGRDARIVRVGSGVYGLAEWGAKSAAAKRRKKRTGRSLRRSR